MCSDKKCLDFTRVMLVVENNLASLLHALNAINSGFQVAVMAPTEILARQHFNLAKKIFPKNIKIELLSGKSEYKVKKNYLKNLFKNNKN